MKQPVLQLNNYAVSIDTPEGEVQAVRGIDLTVNRREIVCLIGESGCGKTVLCQSIPKLLPGNARIKSGRIFLCGEDITDFRERDMRGLRGNRVSMIFQDPAAALNPTIPVGRQITEAILLHKKMSRAEAKSRAIEAMRLVGIENAKERFGLQPHFFSGGMCQRLVLAIALAPSPSLLLADEPTTALDAIVGLRILDLFREIRDRTDVGILFVSHDLGAVARIADRVAVMYAGKLVEIGTAEEIFDDPRHPYTRALLACVSSRADMDGRLPCIPGEPPSLIDPPPGDAFAPRNPYALAIDYEEMPPMFPITETHSAATWLLDPRAPQIPLANRR